MTRFNQESMLLRSIRIEWKIDIFFSSPLAVPLVLSRHGDYLLVDNNSWGEAMSRTRFRHIADSEN